MKSLNRSVAVGMRVIGKVEEKLTVKDLIINFQGDLIRVQNLSGQIFQTGDPVPLVITHVKPLSFKLATSSGPRKFQVSI